jgi:hypothetical protein
MFSFKKAGLLILGILSLYVVGLLVYTVFLRN